jgi:hypothetical protein
MPDNARPPAHTLGPRPVAAPRARLVAGAAPGTGAEIGTRTNGTTGTGGGTARSPNKNAGRRPVEDSPRTPAGRPGESRPPAGAGIGEAGTTPTITTASRWSMMTGRRYAL